MLLAIVKVAAIIVTFTVAMTAKEKVAENRRNALNEQLGRHGVEIIDCH